jgi:hypothetical protein
MKTSELFRPVGEVELLLIRDSGWKAFPPRLAVWNGLPAVGKGGTGDVVDYALRKGIRLLHIEPIGRTVGILRTRATSIDNAGRQL